MIKFGSRVFDKADQRHTAIVKAIVHKSDGSFASIKFEESGWWAHVPLAHLSLAPDEPVEQTECGVLRQRLEARRLK